MSTPYVYIPLANPVRFHQQGNGDFAQNLAPWFEQGGFYGQPYLFQDRPYLQILIGNTSTTVYIDLIDNEYNQYKRWNMLPMTNSPQYGSLYVYHWTNALPSSSEISAGVYFLRLTVISPEGPLVFYSEPMRIAASFEDTLQIIYTHDVNEFDLYFSQGAEFLLRVEGGVRSEGFSAGGKFTMYEDIDYNPVQLSATPFNVYKFIFGNPKGIPNCMIDRINRILSMQYVTIDGTRYNRNEGAKWERSGTDKYSLASYSIDLIKNENLYSDEFAYVRGTNPLTCDSTLFTCDNDQITCDQTLY